MKPEQFDIAYDHDSQCFVYCIYNIEGKPCTYYVLNDKASEQLAKYQDINFDLSQAKDAVEELSNSGGQTYLKYNDIVNKALFELSITLIIKCFNSSKDGRALSLNYKDVFHNNPELKDLYLKIEEIRNSSVAHSGDYMNTLILYFDNTSKELVDLRYSHIKRLWGPQVVAYDKLISIIEHIQEYVNKKIERVRLKLINFFQEQGVTYFQSQSKQIDLKTVVRTEKVAEQLISESFVRH